MRDDAWLSDEAAPTITLNKWGASREEVPKVQSHYLIIIPKEESIEDKVKMEIGKTTANMYKMRHYMSQRRTH